MTRRGAALLLTTAAALLCALSTGSRVYYLAALCFALALVYGLVCAVILRCTLRTAVRLYPATLHRGEDARLHITVTHHCPLPVSGAQVQVEYADLSGVRAMDVRPFHPNEMTLPLPATHVGAYFCGVRFVQMQDMFGLFCVQQKVQSDRQLLVLPKPFDIDKPTFAPGDVGRAALSRSQEDYTSPEDVRAYIPGDAIKRVHWKLSSRKRELLVRRYETPAPPDTLILVDQAAPQGEEGDRLLSLRDAICETAVAVAAMQLADGSPVRAPFYGKHANEFASDNAASLPLLQEMLALQPFDGQESFAVTLNLELRRMGRTGAAIIITTQLTPQIVDAISHMRRMGPHARLYLVTYTPEDEALRPLVTQLQHHLVEVCYVTPA